MRCNNTIAIALDIYSDQFPRSQVNADLHITIYILNRKYTFRPLKIWKFGLEVREVLVALNGLFC